MTVFVCGVVRARCCRGMSLGSKLRMWKAVGHLRLRLCGSLGIQI